MQAAGKWSLTTACRGPRSRPGTSSWPLEETRRTRTALADHSTVREYHRKSADNPG